VSDDGPNTTVLAGRYRLVREIARSMEATYEAFDERLARPVAVKELLVPPGTATAEVEVARRRFLGQATTGAAVTHPNVCKTLDALEEDGRAYLVLEYVEGRGLDEIMEAKGRMPLRTAVEIVCGVLDALAAAGRAGIVHGDIKPGNILLTADGAPRILDFGIAVREGETPERRAGTPNYLAPEQLRGKPLDRRADIFSAGVLLYHLASGERPFAATSVKEILERIEWEEPRMPADWPLPLCAIIRKALSKEPTGRLRDAGEMLAALRDVLPGLEYQDEGRCAPTHSDAERELAARHTRTERVGLALLAVSVVAFGATIAIAVIMRGR